MTIEQVLARKVCLSSVVRVGLCVEALGRLPFSLLRFFWASKRNEGAHQITFANTANPNRNTEVAPNF